MTDQIKCGRIIYDLVCGDTIVDNGICLQLITRFIKKDKYFYNPRISKKAFILFKKNPYVKINHNHPFNKKITLYTYNKGNSND